MLQEGFLSATERKPSSLFSGRCTGITFYKNYVDVGVPKSFSTNSAWTTPDPISERPMWLMTPGYLPSGSVPMLFVNVINGNSGFVAASYRRSKAMLSRAKVARDLHLLQ
jgi:hypothetical protein